jgi:hypothetical protein
MNFKTVAIFLLFVFSTAFSQNKGGRWQMENSGIDTADWDSFADSGELQGAAAFGSDAPLQEGAYYLSLDTSAVHDFLLIPDSDDLDFQNENVGISAWIYPIVLRNDVHFLINKGDQFPAPKTTNYALRISSSQQLEFLIRDANDRAHTVSSSFKIAANQWTFIAAFYDFAAGKVYLWNAPVPPAADTLDFNQPIFGNDDPLSIGTWFRSDPQSPSIKDFEGRIDDVRISGRLQDILPVTPSAVDVNPDWVPQNFVLHQNYPNPFNPATSITLELPSAERVSLRVFNSAGQHVLTLVDGYRTAGRHEIKFEASRLSSGLYFYQLKTARYLQTRKMLLIR